MLQNIINFIGSNIWVIFIIGAGLFNVSIRLAQKFNEQRQLRDAHAKQKIQRQDDLRTGRQAPQAQPNPQRAQNQSESAAEDQALLARKARIEQLRKDRIAQLQLLRQQNASASTQGSQSSSRVASPMPPAPRPRRTPRPTQTSVPSAVSARSAQKQISRPTPTPTPTPTPSPQRASRQVRTVRSDEFERLTQSQSRPQTQRKKPTQISEANNAYSKKPMPKQPRDPNQARKTRPRSMAGSGIGSAREMLNSKGSLRQAMILKEILDAPVALRDESIMAGSLMGN